MTYNQLNILLGPYYGDWKEEVLTFRPFVKYVYEMVSHNRIIISSHYNRSFLYHWVDDFIPIEKEYSEDEWKQKGFIHRDIDQKEYFKKSRQIKNKIQKEYDCGKKELVHYNVPYVKNQTSLSIYQKIFTKIETDIERESDVLLIPSAIESRDKLQDLYNKLSEHLNVTVVGDKKCYLQDKNVLNVVEYANNGYKYIMEYINGAKLIVTPCSHWTFLGNLQQIPTFSWGKFISPYKRKGLYSFDNENMIVPSMDNDKLVNQILFFRSKLEE